MTESKTVVIVESPGKVKKIQGFLGNDYKVTASVGHIRDLPQKELGVSAHDFKPTYVPTERGAKVIKDLAAIVKDAKAVILATDHDREGEAIAWHLQDALHINNPLRVTYAEITETAVKTAVSKPRGIDYNLVKAQEARRVLDRIVGYKVSPKLSEVMGAVSSAGRVQTPALRLVVEREEAIRAFKPTTHYGVQFNFGCQAHITDGWHVEWLPKEGWLAPGQEYFLDKNVAEQIAAVKILKVADCKESESSQAPPSPFTTSSLQQAASNALKMSPKETMEIAQRLYENGHITYMRTDSPNLSDEALRDIRHVASLNDWPMPAQPRTWKSKGGAQEAHEAVRPTHFEVESAGETEQEQALYRLIRIRALASQLENAEYAVTAVKLMSEIDGILAYFEGKGRRLTNAGWRVALPDGDQTEEETEESSNPIPNLTVGTEVTAEESKVLTKKTKPPARYTEASLIKALERMEIGRPSTYAAILSNIVGRQYVAVEKRQLKSTPQGENIVKALLGNNFSFTDYEFTKKVEAELDEIAEGKKAYIDIVRPVAEQLENELKSFLEASGFTCECGRSLHHFYRKDTKDKKGYDFFGCAGYAEGHCKNLYENHGGKPGPKIETYSCECGQGNLRRFQGTNNGKAYDFFSCPACKEKFTSEDGRPGTKIEKRTAEPSGFKCQVCGGDLTRRSGTKNGNAYDFYGCLNFPKCETTYSVAADGAPVFLEHNCPTCGSYLKRLTGTSKKGPYDFFSCSGKKCKETFAVGGDGTPTPHTK